MQLWFCTNGYGLAARWHEPRHLIVVSWIFLFSPAILGTAQNEASESRGWQEHLPVTIRVGVADDNPLPTEAFSPPAGERHEHDQPGSTPFALSAPRISADASTTWQFLFVPSLNFTSDEGLGGGLTFTFFRKSDAAAQLQEEFRLRLFMTSQFSHRHELTWYIRNVANLPLQLQTRIGFFSTRSAHFCGLGANVTCNEAEASQAYQALSQARNAQGLTTPWSQAEFSERYFRRRYFTPYFRFLMQWKAVPRWPVNMILGWALAHEQPGSPIEQTPFPNNRYSELFPNGEAGRHSTLRVGILAEELDLEAWPSEGFRALFLVRAADVWTGSSWNFYGIHTDVAGYFRFPEGSANIAAIRLLYDEIQGDAPSLELSQISGLQQVSAFGGPQLGRGIRERRFNGHQKLIQQGEYRVPFATFRILRHDLGLALVSFYDVAWIQYRPERRADALSPLNNGRWLLGLGLGVRFLIDRIFLFRVDFASSPHEQMSPFAYAVMGTPF